MDTNIREYNEEGPVLIRASNEAYSYGLSGLLKLLKDDNNNNDRLCIVATNEGGYNSTCVDLIDVLKWCYENGITYEPQNKKDKEWLMEQSK